MTAERTSESGSDVQRALKVVMMTDLVDSTALVESLGDARAARVFERIDRLARDLLTDYNGIEIDRTDGFLFIFDRALDAVRCALSYHHALSDLSDELGARLAARVGIHLGEVCLRRNRPEYVARGAKPLELEGLAKPLTARLMSLAQGTQTLLTRTAFDVARRSAVGDTSIGNDVVWRMYGRYRLKGIAEGQQVCEVGRRGHAPLKTPVGSDKVSPSDDAASAWHPAAGLAPPGREGWVLERLLGRRGSEELWLATQARPTGGERTLGYDEQTPEPDVTAMLFSSAPSEGGGVADATVWRLHDPVTCLVIVSGSQAGTYATVAEEPFFGGRDPSMALHIHDPKVSRHHFEIRRAGGTCRVRPLRAKNGVFVNGIAIEGEEPLRNRDRVRVGETELIYYQDAGRPG
jgi:class 3 adenylate cyclase